MILPSFPSSNTAMHASLGGRAAASLGIGRRGLDRREQVARPCGRQCEGDPGHAMRARVHPPRVGTRNYTETGVEWAWKQDPSTYKVTWNRVQFPVAARSGRRGGTHVTDPDQRDRDYEALQERLTRLSEASLRINESLDFDEVLQGVLDAARSLTARPLRRDDAARRRRRRARRGSDALPLRVGAGTGAGRGARGSGPLDGWPGGIAIAAVSPAPVDVCGLFVIPARRAAATGGAPTHRS